MYCKNCRIEVKEGATFCPKCGSANSLTSEKPAKPKIMNRKKILLIIGGVVSLIAVYCLVCLIIAISKWPYPNLHAKKLSADTDSSDFQIGDYLSFGEYQGEEIEWRILDKDGDSLLVISEYGLNTKPYNTERENVTWETCSLRRWLNDDFLMGAFSTDERKRIRLSHIEAERNLDYDTDTVNDTLDYVFLLGINEAERYFASDEDRMCRPMEGALGNGDFASYDFYDSFGNMYGDILLWDYRNYGSGKSWWVRSVGYCSDRAAAYVHGSYIGYPVDCDTNCVRPALWINLDSVSIDSSNIEKEVSANNDGSSDFATDQLANAVSSDLQIGDHISFGKYQGEEIEWRVLDKDGDNLLVISEYGLDARPYNEEYVDVTWETCSLRKWLNSDFLMGAFSTDERKRIRLSHIEAERNPEYGTDPGNDTSDYVFLLSISEAERFFASDEDRMCRLAEYVLKENAWINDTGSAWWWLRSPGYNSSTAANVFFDGNVDYLGPDVLDGNGRVRPALWINLDS